MTTIVMNTLNGAVTEYDWSFQSLSPTRAAGPNLYTLGGANDKGTAIASEVRTGRPLVADGGRAGVDHVYFALESSGSGHCIVEGDAGERGYDFTVRASGISRAAPGKGISGNRLAFGYQNVAGVDFTLDRIEPTLVPSKTRRIG